MTALCLLLVPAVLCAAALDVPKHTSDLFVNDFANVISADDRQKIQKRGEELFSKTQAQLAVATVESLGGADIETYANEMFRSWQLGDKEKNNGVLLLLSVSDRKVRIEVGYGLEGALNDSKCGRILREYGNPYFSDNDFSEGLALVYAVLVNEVCDEYGIDAIADEGYTLGGTTDENTYTVDSDSFEIAILVFVVIACIISGFFKRLRRRRRGGAFFGPFDDDYRGSGFFGGGSGFSGGGGGGFGGGGGSSGGGGASGSF